MKTKDKYQKAFAVFRKYHQEVPLEVFGSDPYKTLVSTLLSARTNDDTTLPVSNRLFQKAPDIAALDAMTQEEIQRIIYPVGFYKTKAKHLKQTARIIMTKHYSNIPKTRVELEELPGVGRKTANLVLARAFGQAEISVDTHVHRISNMLGWVSTDDPIQTERKLRRILPRKYWPDVNRLMVGLGRQFRSKKKLYEFLQEQELIKKISMR